MHQNGFWVLWATSMPSVLVELDFICNPNSAKYLGSSKGQAELAKGIGEAVKTYIDRVKKTAQVQVEQNEPVVAAPIAGDYAVLAPAAVVDDRTVGAAPKPVKAATPAKRRRRSEASKERSQRRVLETDEIQVTTSESRPALTAQAQPSQQPAKTVNQQPAAKKAKTAGKAKQPKNNRTKKVRQPARQTAQATPAETDKKTNKQQPADKKQVAAKNVKQKQSKKSSKKGSTTTAARPVTAQAQTSQSGGKTVNVKKPRLNP